MPDLPDWYQGFQLVGSDITINVNIEASGVTLPIDIATVTADLDVTIIASDVTIDIIFTDQSVAVWGAAAWFSRQGEQVFVTATANRATGTSGNIATRTVPTGKTFYIAGMAWGQTGFATPAVLWAQLSVAGSPVALKGSVAGDSVIYDVPIRATTGQAVALNIGYVGSGAMDLRASFWGWDEED